MYVRFAALLLGNVVLGKGKGKGKDEAEKGDVNEAIQDMLVASLVNIRRELKFFVDVAARYGLDLDIDSAGGHQTAEAEAGDGVRCYEELFREMGEGVEAGEVEFVEALVLLWGTEKVCVFSLSLSLFLSLFLFDLWSSSSYFCSLAFIPVS